MEKNKPNLIFIMTDEQHLRSLSCYGGTALKTPAIDRMADEGNLFENAFCVNPVCMPSRAMFMTGRYSHTNGLRVNGMTLRRNEISLPEIMKASGYKTAICGKNHCFDNEKLESVFDHHFTAMHAGILDEIPDDFPDKSKEANDYYRKLMEQNGRMPFANAVIPYAPDVCDAGLLTESAVRFVNANKDQPFFMWLSFPGPHWPFTCPEAYENVVPPEQVDMPQADELNDKPKCQKMFKKLLGLDKAKENDFRKVISRYYGNFRYIDDQIGRIFKLIEELHLDDNTIFCFTSDHGEYLGEHGLMHKSRAVYDCLMRIPFIWRWKGRITPETRCAEMVENIDFLPTALDLCGIEIPPGVQGVSHANALQGKCPFHQREAVFGEYGLEGGPFTWKQFEQCTPAAGPYDNEFSDWIDGPPGFKNGKIKMARTKKWKLGYYTDKEQHELYDLENDPYELHNLYNNPEYKDIIAELKEKLLRWTVNTEDTAPPFHHKSEHSMYKWNGECWKICK